MSSTKALVLLALLAVVGLAAASSSTDANAETSVSLRRDLKTLFPFAYHQKFGFYKFDHYPELKIKVKKYKESCDDCEEDDYEYKCDDDCEDDCDECDHHENTCYKKYIRRCYYKDSHNKCDCEKTHKKKYYVVIKKKDHCS